MVREIEDGMGFEATLADRRPPVIGVERKPLLNTDFNQPSVFECGVGVWGLRLVVSFVNGPEPSTITYFFLKSK